MFYFIVQYIDLLVWGVVGLFLVFYALSWFTLLVKLIATSFYRNENYGFYYGEVSVIIPVYNEPIDRFKECLASIDFSTYGFDRKEIIVVENGAYTPEYKEICDIIGAQYFHIQEKGKRFAIAKGVSLASYKYTVLLDSDTIARQDTIPKLLQNFEDDWKVGGVVPKQRINENDFWSRICNWYEDIRFGNTTPGLSFFKAVPCLIGRLYAVRTHLLKEYMPEFVNQKILGFEMETGDDRVITNYVLQRGFKTIYDDKALVSTFAPADLKSFIKQRTRWSRSSFSETVLATTWLWKHPYALFVMWSDIIMRWFFFAVVAVFAFKAITWSFDPHVLNMPWWVFMIGGFVGFFISGYLKQIPHLIRHPKDIWLTPAFLLITTFILTPVEWYGNITCLDRGRNGWLTRNKSNA